MNSLVSQIPVTEKSLININSNLTEASRSLNSFQGEVKGVFKDFSNSLGELNKELRNASTTASGLLNTSMQVAKHHWRSLTPVDFVSIIFNFQISNPSLCQALKRDITNSVSCQIQLDPSGAGFYSIRLTDDFFIPPSVERTWSGVRLPEGFAKNTASAFRFVPIDGTADLFYARYNAKDSAELRYYIANDQIVLCLRFDLSEKFLKQNKKLPTLDQVQKCKLYVFHQVYIYDKTNPTNHVPLVLVSGEVSSKSAFIPFKNPGSEPTKHPRSEITDLKLEGEFYEFSLGEAQERW